MTYLLAIDLSIKDRDTPPLQASLQFALHDEGGETLEHEALVMRASWQANEELLFFIEERLSKLVVGECSPANTKTDNNKMDKLL